MERSPGGVAERRRPPHPGEVFLEDFLAPLGMTQKEAAERLGISYPRMNEIVNAKRSVTPETALRLGRFTDTEPEFWLDLQQAVDLWEARHAEGAEEIREIEPAVAPDEVPPGRLASGGRVRPERRADRYRVARVFPLGAEPPDDLRRDTSAVERLGMLESLTRASWRLSGGSWRRLDRTRLAVRVVDRDRDAGDGTAR